MKNLLKSANEIKEYISSLKEVTSCTLYGSLANGNFDEYSDIDLEVDVSGYDNGIFLTKLPEIMSIKYPVIFYDYAPSLLPNSYVISIAIDENHPFRIVDFKCVATPHCTTLGKEDLIINKVEHTMKLWTANYKHYLRGKDCLKDIIKMAKRVMTLEEIMKMNEKEILHETLNWLENNCEERHYKYIENCKRVFQNI